ncbi:MAG: hypothetical protein ACI4VP_02610 [Clostridia bacterium]
MQKKIKMIILTLILVCIVLIGIIALFNRRANKEVISETENIEGAYEFDLNKIKRVKNKSDYYLVNRCINKFYSNYIKNNDIYNLLDDEYINMFNIKEDNLNDKFGKFEDLKIDLTDVYVSEIGIGISQYFIYGYLMDITTNNITDLAMIVRIDTGNQTFSIFPYEYLEKNGYLNITENSKIDMEEVQTVRNKKDNTFIFQYIDDETYMKYMFENYIYRCLYNPTLAYECLDAEYKEKRFGNIEKFKEFIDEKKDIYISYDSKNNKQYGDFNDMNKYLLYLAQNKQLNLKSYKKTKYDDYMEYVIIDNFENYYIFRETNIMQYKLLLDTYTIDLPEFIEKYYGTEPTEKVALNIQKIFEAINNKDYNYVYGKLADGFKKNYFPTLDSFEKYAKEKFYDRNEVEYLFYEKESEEYYSYTIKISDKDTGKSKNLKIIMQLQSGTNFVMSFNVN